MPGRACYCLHININMFGSRLCILAALATGLLIVTPVEARQPFSASASPDEIAALVEQMDVPTLLGQVLMVGYEAPSDHERSNEALKRLIRHYHIGNIILYGYNFPTQWKIADPIAVANVVADLTTDLQETAYNSQPRRRHIPLLIAIDQEGGRESRITNGASRIPNQIFIGTTRSSELAFKAGEVIASELAAMGIHINLSPVADINTIADSDLIARRSFGAHKDIVAPLSVAWMKGLQKGGVLSVAKHFPGHGQSQGDPHFDSVDIGYADEQGLLNNDIFPFAQLVNSGVDGIMTSHIRTPLDDEFPVTMSSKAIALLRRDLKFSGLVVADDLTEMMGILKDETQEIVRSREDVARMSILSGHDLLIFGCISEKEHPELSERTVTEKEFSDIYRKLQDHFEGNPQSLALLRASASRVLLAKSRVFGLNRFNDHASWNIPFDRVGYRQLLDRNAAIASEIAEKSIVLITEDGRPIRRINQSKYFGTGRGPLNKNVIVESGDKVVLASPVFAPPDELYRIVSGGWLPADRLVTIRMISGWRGTDARKEAEKLWKEAILRYSTTDNFGKMTFHQDAIRQKADEIVNAASDAKLLIFGALVTEQIEILKVVCQKLLEREAATKIIVLMYREPYFLPPALFKQQNVTVVYLSRYPDAGATGKLLYGEIEPRPIGHMPVTIENLVNREKDAGIEVAPQKPENLPEQQPDAEKNPQPARPSWLGAFLAGLAGSVFLYLIPRGRVRVGKNSQYGRADIITIFAIGMATTLLVHLGLDQAKSFTYSGFVVERLNTNGMHFAAEGLFSFVIPLLYLLKTHSASDTAGD